MSFTHEIRIRYAEVDAQGVVFNAHWLTYLDEAMTRFCEAIGYPPVETFTADGPFDVMLRRTTLEFEGPAGFDQVVAVEVVPVRLGTSSFDLRFTARVGDRIVLVATTTYVVVVPGQHLSMPIPDDLRAELTARSPERLS